MMGLLPTGSLVTLMILAARSLFAVMVVVLLSDAISPQHTVPLEASANAKQPHLIFILVDDLGWNDIGLHDERVQTPTIDALAQDGVVLDRHYVYRYCSPTRGAFLSGRFPHHDHQANPGPESAFGPNINMTILPAKLQAVGYRTAYRGKWHYGFSKPEFLPVARGFEDAAGYLQGACDHLTEVAGCAVDSWRSNSSYSGPDIRNGTGYDSFRHAQDMVDIIERQPTDVRPLFLYAALHVAHEPLEAPANFITRYSKNPATSTWCASKQIIAAMASVADNVTAQIVTALQGTPNGIGSADPITPAASMWDSTVLVFSSDNGGDTSCSSNFPLRGRKRTFFEAFVHIADWYATFGYLAGVTDNPSDAGPGRFAVDGRNLWPYLSSEHPDANTVQPPQFHNVSNFLVLGYNYSTLNYWKPGYDAGTGALIEITTGYKLIVGSQNLCKDGLNWDARNYPCGDRSANGPDCTPHCLYNVLADPSERHELSTARNATVADRKALTRLVAAYAAVGTEAGMPNIIDTLWNEQGTPYDPRACPVAEKSGYWQPWILN